jgi:hypothetical protein
VLKIFFTILLSDGATHLTLHEIKASESHHNFKLFGFVTAIALFANYYSQVRLCFLTSHYSVRDEINQRLI